MVGFLGSGFRYHNRLVEYPCLKVLGEFFVANHGLVEALFWGHHLGQWLLNENLKRCRVCDLALRVKGWLRDQGSGLRAQGSGFRVQGSGFRV